MKRVLAISILLILIIIITSFTGCINPVSQIKGYVVNAHTETVRVDIYRESTKELEDSKKCPTGSSVSLSLPPGKYNIEAYDYDERFIGSVEFTLPPESEDFYISVFTYKVTARYNK